MKLVRTFHPVGHGAFYTERFYQNDPLTETPLFTAVLDCGCFEACKAGTNPQFFEQQINRAIDNVFNQGDIIDALFISHFHTDHINGIPHLFQKCTIKRIFVPILTPRVIIEAYTYNFISSQNINNLGNNILQKIYYDEDISISQIRSFKNHKKKELSHNDIDINKVKSKVLSSTTHLSVSPDWEYIPFNLLNGQMKSLLFKGSPFKHAIVNGKVDFDILRAIVTSLGVQTCQSIYKNTFPQGHNSYSMTVLSNNLRPLSLLSIRPLVVGVVQLSKCMYMGDFEANPTFPKRNNNFKSFEAFYFPYWNQVDLLQVPHHGSEHNYNQKLYNKKRVCLISSGDTDIYGHPDQYVVTEIQRNNCIYIIETETTPKLELTYRL